MEKKYTKFWKKLAHNKNVSTRDVIVHCALKAFFAKETNKCSKEDIFKSLLTKSFTPVTNKNRLANGATKWDAIRIAFYYMQWGTVIPIFGMTRDEVVKEIFDTQERYEEFNSFIKCIIQNKDKFLKSLKKRYYSYIFVDQENVEPIYQTVQAAHAAMVIGQKMDKRFDAANVYFQICKKPSDLSIEFVWDDLLDFGYKSELFYEPDVDRHIAEGTHPIPDYKRNKFLLNSELLTF